jgi:hypothetical protein
LALLDGAIRRREGFRLVALDLRDGESQGAFGAVDQVRESDDWCFAHDHALSVARRHANRLAEGLFVASLCNERTRVALDLSEARAMLVVECSSVSSTNALG